MHPFRRILAHAPSDTVGRWRNVKMLALVLAVVLPGGLVLPIVYGLYGAIRHTLSPKGQARSAPEASTAASSALDSEARD